MDKAAPLESEAATGLEPLLTGCSMMCSFTQTAHFLSHFSFINCVCVYGLPPPYTLVWAALGKRLCSALF